MLSSLYAIIVAGGSGSRMQTSLPKQFAPIGGLPILMHTIRRFYDFSSDISIILVLPAKDIATWENLCKEYNFNIPLQIVAGGPTRFDSVKNGLVAITDDEGLVAVHDGVRPFVSKETIHQSFELAKQKGCAVTAVPLKDSIRIIDDKGKNQAVDRNNYRLIQTPQTFRISILKQSFSLVKDPSLFTDDASVAEKAGFTIHLIKGSYQNIKITTPDDLIWAETFVAIKNQE